MASKASSSESSRFNNEEIRIVMVGKTGAGKSATGNTILRGTHFPSRFSPTYVTTECAKGYVEWDRQAVAVIDTPGLFNTNFEKSETLDPLSESISFAAPGPHIFLIIIKLGRLTKEEKKSVENIQKLYGEEANRYSMVLFTHGDQLKGKTIEEFMSGSEDLQKVVDQCNGQYHVFNNELEDDSQVRELLNKIKTIVQKNGGSHYTIGMFHKAEEEIEREKERILKEKEEQMRKEQEELKKKAEKGYEKRIWDIEVEMEKERQAAENEREAKREAESSTAVLKVIGIALGAALAGVALDAHAEVAAVISSATAAGAGRK